MQALPSEARGHLAVAYSGGRDSTALLHASVHAAAAQGLMVHALHVHHGLSRHADDWLAHCEEQCRRWAAAGLPLRLHAERLALRPQRGESVEALARTARYAALRRLAQQNACGLVLLAHHRRDQAETLLLQALRGAGVAGLAGMPASIERAGLVWARPWLAQPREAIEAYVRAHRLRYIDDDSNGEPRFARNRLRLAVWPALCAAFPEAESTLADAAAWAREATACARDLAALDLAACADGAVLDLTAWRRLAPHRAGNALRAWLQRCSGRTASAAEVERLLEELPARAGPAHWLLRNGSLRRYRGRLSYEAVAAEAQGGEVPENGENGEAAGAEGEGEAPGVPREASVCVRRAGRYALPGWGGVLVARRVREGGVALKRLARLGLLPRQGGERFQSGPGRPPRSLKKQFQAAALPAWVRGGPLLFDGEQLVFVPGLGIDARVLAEPGEPQVLLRWEAR